MNRAKLILKVQSPAGTFFRFVDEAEYDYYHRIYDAVGWNYRVVGAPLNWGKSRRRKVTA